MIGRKNESGLRFTLKKCGYCKGSGYSPIGYSFCPVCSGHGHVLVVRPARKCGACGGSGLGLVGNDTCSACGGTGWAYAKTSL